MYDYDGQKGFRAFFTSKYTYLRSDNCVLIRLLWKVCFGYEFELYQYYIKNVTK